MVTDSAIIPVVFFLEVRPVAFLAIGLFL